jgi:hypothetical protein
MPMIEIMGVPMERSAHCGTGERASRGKCPRVVTVRLKQTGEIETWLSGTTNPPAPIFLAIVDIVAANSLAPVALENLPLARARRSATPRP